MKQLANSKKREKKKLFNGFDGLSIDSVGPHPRRHSFNFVTSLVFLTQFSVLYISPDIKTRAIFQIYWFYVDITQFHQLSDDIMKTTITQFTP